MLGNFLCFCCRLLSIFSKLTFSLNSFKNTIRVSNGLEPDQDGCSVGPDLDPNCLQRLSADNKVATSMEKVKYLLVNHFIIPYCLTKYQGSFVYETSRCQSRHKALVPQSLRLWRDLSATDFVCDHCNYHSTTGMVADQSPISHHTFSDHFTFSLGSVHGKFRVIDK